mmetsp:Transcript_32572/g.56394  ORF Transcript_32572/g.56394 Transcript_32572/m.56394 type:complete len:152 (+) Transcript_32572:3548-4003(+)
MQGALDIQAKKPQLDAGEWRRENSLSRDYIFMGIEQSLPLSCIPKNFPLVSLPPTPRPPRKVVRFSVSALTEDEEDSHTLFRMLAKDSERSEFPRNTLERQKTLVYSKLVLEKSTAELADSILDSSQCTTPPVRAYPKLSKPAAKIARMSI